VLSLGCLVIGASDLQSVTSDGQLEAFSGAHRGFDGEGMKTMGRPFDFDALRATAALPDVYDPAHYLGISSVVNTIYKIFGVDPSRYWTLGRNLPAARTLDGLLG
jgi:hypothetical protein